MHAEIKNKKISCDRGFSTLEMLIAMTILIMVLSAIILVTFSNQSIGIDNETNSEALNKAKEVLEQEQAWARKDFKMVNPTNSTDGIYQKTVSVANVDFFTKRVTSSIAWSVDHNRPQHIDLTALVTNFENSIGGDTCYSNLSGNWASPQIKNSPTSFASIVVDASGTYPVSDIDVYQNKMYVSVASVGTAPTAGPNTTASSASDIAISGGATWSNVNNALTSNAINSTSSVPLNNTKVTHYLKLTGFNFSIPAWATVTGIKVEIQKSRGSSGSGSIVDSQVKIVKNNVIGGTFGINKADTVTSWLSSNNYVSYTTDLWGESWSPADINNSGFGVAISATGSLGGTRVAQIDNVRITITYTRQFYVLNINNPSNPTFVSALASNTITTGMNAVTTDGRYAYVATNSSSGQFQIIDLNTSPPSLFATLKLGTAGTSVGNSIFFKNGYIYLGLTHTAGGPNEFNIIDVHTPNNPLLVGSFPIGYIVNDIYVKNNYAYIVHDTDSSATNQEQITVLDILDSANPQRKSGYRAPDIQGSGKSLYTVGDSIYLGRTVTTSPNSEFYILDNSDPVNLFTNNPNTPTPPQGQKISSSVNALLVRDYLAFILKGTTGNAGALQIYNISNPSSVTSHASLALPNASAGISKESMDCEGNNIFVSSTPSSGTNANKADLFVIAP